MNDYFGTGIFFLVLILVFQSVIGSYFSANKIKYFHETGIAIILGIILSAIAYFGFDYTVSLEKPVFIYIFLPAIIFSEGYSMKKRHFFKNMPYILTYGLLGTVITFASLLIVLNVISNNHNFNIQVLGGKKFDGESMKGEEHAKEGDSEHRYIQLNIKDLSLFSAALSSKDSFIASTLVDHHSYPFLFHIIFGEGIVNDAMSIILFDSFEQLIDEEVQELEWSIIPNILWIIFKSVSISIIAGVLSGVICTLILKYFIFLNKTVVHEILVIFFCSYASFSIVESFHLSGVLSLMVSGFIIGHYAFYNLSEKGKICSTVTFQAISSGAENFLFAYLGFTTFSFYNNDWSFSLIGYSIIIILLARFLSVFVISGVLRCFLGGAYAINLREQIVLQFTGISRGILGYILMDQVEFEENQNVLNSSILGVLIITTLFFGLINPKLIDFLLPTTHHDHDIHKEDQIYHQNHDKILNSKSINEQNKVSNESYEKQINTQKCIHKKRVVSALINGEYDEKLFSSKLMFKLQRINTRYIKPFLIRDYFENFDDYIIQKQLFNQDKFELMRPDGLTKDQMLIKRSVDNMKKYLHQKTLNKFPIDTSSSEKLNDSPSDNRNDEENQIDTEKNNQKKRLFNGENNQEEKIFKDKEKYQNEEKNSGEKNDENETNENFDQSNKKETMKKSINLKRKD